MSLLIAIPIKPFGVAKARLGPVLDARARSRVGKSVAAHTVHTAMATGARVAVVTSDDTVGRWAGALGAHVIRDAPEFGGGLDGAAGAAVAAAARSPWLILPADLPHLSTADLDAAIARFRPEGYVLAPSYDGGTSLLMGAGPFAFSYGPGSFHRHLRAAAGAARVVVRTGLALDLDNPRDLAAARSLGLTGTWAEVPA